MYVPEGTIIELGQDWEKKDEEQEIEEYSEPMGVGEVILGHKVSKEG